MNMTHSTKNKGEDSLVTADVLLPTDILEEIRGFFPVDGTKGKTTYGILSVKINEISAEEKEVIYEGKNKFSRIVNIHEDSYSREEVIFYTYLLLHSQDDLWSIFNSSPSARDKSNLSDFCHDFFSKAKDYTYKGDRGEFSNKRIFEMFLYCSVKTGEEYDLPPFEEYWRIFTSRDVLLPTTYELLFANENNSIRKEAVAQKAFAHQRDFTYLRYLLEQLFSRRDFKGYIDLYLPNADIITFPWQFTLYCNLIESYLALKDFEALKKNLVKEGVRTDFGGYYGREFFEGIATYFEGKYSDAEISFKQAVLLDVEGRDLTRCTTIFYISSLLKQKKNDEARAHIFDLKPREPHVENYDLENFGYKEIEKEVIKELKKLDVSDDPKNTLEFYEASLLYSESWHYFDKDTALLLVKKLKEVRGYENDYTYNYFLSEGYVKLSAYDKAYYTMLKSIACQKEDVYPSYSAEISKTSYDLQVGLIGFIRKQILLSGGSKAFTSLAENELQNVINHWWEEKKYTLLIELCNLIIEYGSLDYFGNYLFEFAYSFKEAGEIDEAKDYYELYIQKKGENSSVLNNLAIIYEQVGNLKKAKELIKKAYDLSDKNDGVINRNRKRLIDDSKSKKTPSIPEKKTSEDTHLTADFLEYDPEYGKLLYRGREQMVRSSKMMPIVLKELFEKPENTKNAVDLLEKLGMDTTTSNRSMLDCIRQINKKIKNLGAKDDPFAYRSDKVLTKETYIPLLRIKVSKVESK
ncbi:hypothetical protein EPN27_01830 [Patescibacteria group bacterium]|nr:MAG: hypothetical protein EPN27_01830 [Patescibacteria group bacterium]